MKNIQLFVSSLVLLSCLLFPGLAWAMPPGTLLYRTSRNGQMYGYSTDYLMKIDKGVIGDIFPGHVGIYIGQEDGVDYVVEALADGVVKIPAKHFVNLSEGEEFLGAKLPEELSTMQRIKAVMLAKNLAEANLRYDFDFKTQKGPGSGEWTCVGLTEKIYESANISNPNNLAALEYDSAYYAVDITPDGFDNTSVINSDDSCFSEEVEFSSIAQQKNMILPAPELIGFDAGLEHGGERYIFFPYTQFLQESLDDVEVDVQISSSFADKEIRGTFSRLGLILKWSLINNPLSSTKKIISNAKELALGIKEKLFSKDKSELVISGQEFEVAKKTTSGKTKAISSSSAKESVKPTQARVQVNKKAEIAKGDQNTKEEREIQVVQEVALTPGNYVEGLEIEFPSKELIEVKTAAAQSASEPGISVQKKTTKDTSANTIASSYNTSATRNTAQTMISSAAAAETTDTSSPASITETADEVESEPSETDNDPRLAIISKIYSTGNNDWIELYNPGDEDFDLATSEYRLEKTKTADDPSLAMRIGNPDDGVYPGGTVIKAHDYYLIVRDDAEEEYKTEAQAIATRDEFGWFGSGYTIYLGNSAISSSTDVDVMDAVGFGPDATYFAGTGPAPAISDFYILNRVATSSDNSLDYELLATDKVIIATTTPEEEINVIATSTNDLVSVNSDDISHLWHFDECYGDGRWAVGKWGCARESGYIYDSINIPLNPVVDTNSFSASFYYRKSRNNVPRIQFKLMNDNNDYLQFSLDQGMLEFEGLPNTDWRYYMDMSITDDWDQVVLVVDRDSHYWSFYINGEEVYNREFDEDLLTMNSLEISGNVEAFLMDELVFWNRPLSADEIGLNYNANLPHEPFTERTPQLVAELLYSWDFNNSDEGVARDVVNNLEFDLESELLVADSIDGSALRSEWGKDININFNEAIHSKDLSLSFWWRNSSYPDESRTKVSLRDSDKDRLAIVPNYYRPAFWFNDNYGVISEGVGITVPNDDLWHYLALTYDSYDYLLRFYVDGEQKFSSPFVWIEEGREPDKLSIMSENNSSELDELNVWRGVLSGDEVKELYGAYK